ncbi:MAG: 4Fe-4S dicluster domain-containing protein [Methanotrichaceae archaeon]
MTKRKVIKIDESKCTGCGECISACAEGAIELKNGRARVISDRFCDGLGACLAVCPAGALTIEEREAEEFNEQAAKEHQKETNIPLIPCTAPVSMAPEEQPNAEAGAQVRQSQLANWPIQMKLARPGAPYFKGASLLIAADCTAFAYPNIQDLLRGRVTIVGCPKLDDQNQFVDKLASILTENDIKDITVLHMTVPCCTQITRLVSKAVKQTGKEIPVSDYTVGIQGGIKKA